IGAPATSVAADAFEWRRDFDLWLQLGGFRFDRLRSLPAHQSSSRRMITSDILISLVVAVAENGVIGRDGGLPWRMSSDLKAFRKLTMDKPIIMGRKTFQSIGKPLDGRDNIVVTRDATLEMAGVSTCDSFGDALALARVLAATRGADEIMVIGGASL